MTIAEISRNSFEDDEADFTALARPHSDLRFGHELTRPARLNTVVRSEARPFTAILLIAVLLLCLPLFVWLAWQPGFIGKCGGGAA